MLIRRRLALLAVFIEHLMQAKYQAAGTGAPRTKRLEGFTIESLAPKTVPGVFQAAVNICKELCDVLSHFISTATLCSYHNLLSFDGRGAEDEARFPGSNHNKWQSVI